MGTPAAIPDPGPAAGPDPGPGHCTATLASGKPCRYRAKGSAGLCGVHGAACPECAVCLAPMRRPAVMACGHGFHARCLRAWFKDRSLSCPLCRARCVEGLGLLGRKLAPKLMALMRTVPPPPRAFFPSYMVAQLETPHVVAALGADKDLVELLIDLACECFTRDVFFAKLRAMGL